MSEIWLYITVILEFDNYGIMFQQENGELEYKLVNTLTFALKYCNNDC